MPGLVSKSQRRSGISQSSVNTVKSNSSTIGHKLLVHPNVFNIGSLLPPSLSFLQRLKEIVPHDSHIAMSTLTSFLDEFLVNVFQPQLEETVTDLCNQSFAQLDAYHTDPQWSICSSKPIFKVRYLCHYLRGLLIAAGNVQFLQSNPFFLQIARHNTP